MIYLEVIPQLEDICKSSAQTALNTSYDFMTDGFSFIGSLGLLFSIISLALSVFIFQSQKNTEGNTRKLSRDAQYSLLLDLTRHLYRNLVITYAMYTKLVMKDFKGYPSEEHFIKLKVPMENIHLEAFYGSDIEYKAVHDLYLKMRNYNVEIDVACEHMKNPKINVNVRKRDFNTLLLKSQIIIDFIITTIETIWKDEKDYLFDIRQTITDAQSGKTNSKANITSDYTNYEPFFNENNCYSTILFTDKKSKDTFYSNLNRDVKEELGVNLQNASKIEIIDFE